MGFLLEDQRFDPTPWSLSNGGPKLQRWTVSLENGRMSCQRRGPLICDMPTFHPNRNGLYCRYVYTVFGVRQEGFFPFNAIGKIDLETGAQQIWPPEAAALALKGQPWDGGSSVYSEPLFVPRHQGCTDDEEDDGFILSTVHDSMARETRLEVFDARHLAKGPIRTIPLGELWGWNVHSSFEPM